VQWQPGCVVLCCLKKNFFTLTTINLGMQAIFLLTFKGNNLGIMLATTVFVACNAECYSFSLATAGSSIFVALPHTFFLCASSIHLSVGIVLLLLFYCYCCSHHYNNDVDKNNNA